MFNQTSPITHPTSRLAILAAIVACLPATSLFAASSPNAPLDAPLSIAPTTLNLANSPLLLASTPDADGDDTPAAAATKNIPASSDSRYGLFKLLDHRSIYGKDWFPEPLLADEADVDNEVAFSYFHQEGHAAQSDEAHVEIEKSFGMLTLEIAGGYESDRASGEDTAQGFTNIELGARYPIFQYVSPNGFFDTTLVFGLEFSPATNTAVSKDTEIVPKLFSLTRIGEHLSIQLGLGDSLLVGPDDGGSSSLEYDLVLGYQIDHDQLPIPLTVSIVPIFEIDGENQLNHDDAGHNALTGTVGLRLNFESIGSIQPKLGLGYTFPIDTGAREEFDWGLVASLIFEY